YVMVLRPRTPATLVGEIRLSVDAERRVPPAVGGVSRGGAPPAGSVPYTPVGFRAPRPPGFPLSPPPGGAGVRGIPGGWGRGRAGLGPDHEGCDPPHGTPEGLREGLDHRGGDPPAGSGTDRPRGQRSGADLAPAVLGATVLRPPGGARGAHVAGG